MRTAARAGAVLWAALATIAATDTCQGPASGETGDPQVEFSVVGALEAGEDATPRVDSVSAGQAVLRGGVSTPTPCYAIRAELSEQADTLRLTLAANAQPVVCIQVLAAFAYRARIHGLTPGRYTVEVVATYPGTGWPPRVEQLHVDIP